jgi:hypothetical protein
VSVARNRKFICIAIVLSLIGGCQYVGPIAIDQGRNRYNSIIQSTTKQQTFVNIIAVRNHEPTSFMDVTEVDATTTFSGTVAGTVSGIGATATKSTSAGTLAGQVGAVTSGVTYTEQPLIRYAPLLGASLVAQMVTPVSVDALEDLFNSSWNTSPLLDLASSHLTLDQTAVYPVLNILGELDSYNALAFVATKSDLTSSPATVSARSPGAGSGNQGSGNNNKPPPNDALTIYLNPFHPPGSVNDPYVSINRRELQLWIRLLSFYQGTQEKFVPQDPAWCAHIGLSAGNESELENLDRILQSKRSGIDPSAMMKCLPNSIELRTMPVIPAKLRSEGLISGAPLMKTYSAVGILKNATETPHPKIEFVSPERYHEITGYQWNRDLDSSFFYLLLPQSEDPADNPAPSAYSAVQSQADQVITDWIMGVGDAGGRLFVYEPKSKMPIGDYLRLSRRLGSLRRYMLIIVDDQPPANAYVSYLDKGKWYYIDGADAISQKNFNLISLFLTMMAIPSALPPISPTISLGGG